ncbi:hypothetical protein EOW77_0032355 [Bradyrhizobium yuanmingense]|uniref:hypothetical protein n=1 Tax=Bradyrhizobium yuanmingense TaxID=108015 RepID=UPI000FE41F46|nr:hypothetical protein [Bradyrhizobium yuanmingense]TGN75961.1 hypothetical protein EOW77_0032355 [Bradyrhizobium yuanmingense]
MPLPYPHPLNDDQLTTTAASVATGVSGVIRAPFKGRLIAAGTMLGSTVATADATCTVSVAGTAVTGGSFVVTQSGSAIGDHDYASSYDTSANSVLTPTVVNENDLIRFAFTGSGTGGGNVHCYAVIRAG